MGEIVSIHSEAVTIARAMMASSQTKDRVNWWIASLNLAMKPEGASIGNGAGAYIKGYGEEWLSLAIAEIMMISQSVKWAVNSFVLDQKIKVGGFDDEDRWAATVIAAAMTFSQKVRHNVEKWINARKERKIKLRREASRKRAEKAKQNPILFGKVRSNWLKQNSRRKSEWHASIEFIVMQEYKRDISRLRMIEKLTIDKSPCFRTHVNRKRHERDKVRAAEDPDFRIRRSSRARVRRFVKRKSMSTQSLVGCTWSEFRMWLESEFKPGMTWLNYGEWEIDHIIPCSSFDLSNEDQLRKCFHYSNTQPLWKSDNARKGDSLDSIYH